MTFYDSLSLAWKLLPKETFATLYMVFVAGAAAFLAGLPLGVLLKITGRGGIAERRWAYQTLGALVNIGRSIPFAILMVAVIPLSRLIVGTSLGSTAAIVPLSLAAAPFFARLVEGALGEIDRPLVEAALVMGSSPWQIVTKVLLPEAFPSLIIGMTLTLVNLIGYSAMAGLVGGGGLGKVAIQYGYQRFNGFLMVITLVILLILVEIVQWLGNALCRQVLKRRGIAR